MTTRQSGARRPLVRALAGEWEEQLHREWLLTNGRGGFASGTVVGCPTRKYHAYLIAARRPPLERFALLHSTLDTVRVRGADVRLWSLETSDGRDGDLHAHLHSFDYALDPHRPWVEWRYRLPTADIRKRLTMHAGRDLATIDYEISAVDDWDVALTVRPLIVLRDFHAVRGKQEPTDWQIIAADDAVWIEDRQQPGVTLAMGSAGGAGRADMTFARADGEVVDVVYRVEIARGHPEPETPQLVGAFSAQARQRLRTRLAVAGFVPDLDAFRGVLTQTAARPAAASAARPGADRLERRLTAAAGQFVAHRARSQHAGAATVLAGYPWFGDWGRDAFIALEGLLLCTERFTEAREVLETFAGAQRHGLIPNLFDDYGGECHYNSVDASLWYIHAADRYLALSKDRTAWRKFLAAACRNVIEAFIAGTDFDIRVEQRGLLRAGHPQVQITWMDAKCGDVVFTPRHGCPVEVNALWHHALCIAARRFTRMDPTFAAKCGVWAKLCAERFQAAFWREDGRGLCDVVDDARRDTAIRPNQILAVSLPDSPLTPPQQQTVLAVVTEHLLTPYGLRSLSPEDPGYRGRYSGPQAERDAAYHQGTVWSWLIGPYCEAYLRVHAFTDAARNHVRGLIAPLAAHLDEAGLGSISEIFEGDPPHAPRGCFAQAWSVAELLRIHRMLETHGVRA